MTTFQDTATEQGFPASVLTDNALVSPTRFDTAFFHRSVGPVVGATGWLRVMFRTRPRDSRHVA